MFIIKLSKHDKYVHKLCEQIKSSYDTIDTHVTFENSKNRRIAEVDILAKKGAIIDIYEVKCSYRVVKAKKQLKRIKRIINATKMNFFFFCGASSSLEEIVF